MITTKQLGKPIKGRDKGDCSLGNALFHIASVIGIAIKNDYDYGFPEWLQQEYFVNPLPPLTKRVDKKYHIPVNYGGFDFGFRGFDVPDNVEVIGEMGSWRYFEHCKDLIRYYFEIQPLCESFKDCILMHYRDYRGQGFKGWELLTDYYTRALELLPDKRIIVVTDNIKAAQEAIKLNVEYTSNSPIIDFYLLCNADYLVMGNSTFSWWGAYLSGAETVAPLNWFVDKNINEYLKRDTYLKNWKVI